MARLSKATPRDVSATATATTRQTRGRSASVDPEPASTAPRASGRGANNRNNKAQTKKTEEELQTVEEGDDDAPGEEIEEDGAAIPEQSAVNNAQDAALDPRRASGASAISGTTAKTSFSQEEAEQLDHDVMLDVLPDLATACEKLAQFLLPEGVNTKPEIWKEIRTVGSRHHKQYRNRIDAINIHRPKFGTQEYIQPRVILRAMLGDASGMATPGPWRPDNIIFKINLAQMLNSLLVVCDSSDWTKSAMDALERLDVAFPGGIAGSQFSMPALDFYLQFSAQLTIARLEACIESGTQASPASQIDSVFYDENGEFKHAEALGLEVIEEEERMLANNTVDEHVKRLKTPFELEGVDATAANGQLKDGFRWDMLKDAAVQYYLHRSKYLDNSIRNVGGISGILKSLTIETERRINSKNYEQGKERFADPSSTPRTSLGGGMALLKKRLSMVSQQPVAPVAQMIAPAGGVGVEDLAGNHQMSSSAAQNSAETSLQEEGYDAEGTRDVSGFQALQRQHAQQLKQTAAQRQRPRWTDPQPGAVRISAIDDDGQPSQRGKRTHAEMEDDFDPTQDEGFQADTRDVAGADQRRREVAFAQPKVDPVTGVEMSSPSKRQRLNPGSEIPPPTQPLDENDGDLDPGEMYRRAKNMAKFNSVTASQAKPTRTRQPWTEAEETALLKLVEEHGVEGVSYSSLKAIDRDSGNEQLYRRSAEDLRFKARNMKLTLLKAKTELPPNWEYVKLDKKAMDQLASLGIKYEQERSRGT